MSVTYLIVFTVRPEQRERFLSLLNGVLDAMRSEANFVNATLHSDPDDPDRFLLHETWADHQDVLSADQASLSRRLARGPAGASSSNRARSLCGRRCGPTTAIPRNERAGGLCAAPPLPVGQRPRARPVPRPLNSNGWISPPEVFLHHHDLGADAGALVELDDILVTHADAA